MGHQSQASEEAVAHWMMAKEVVEVALKSLEQQELVLEHSEEVVEQESKACCAAVAMVELVGLMMEGVQTEFLVGVEAVRQRLAVKHGPDQTLESSVAE